MKKLLIAILMIAVFVAFCYGQADYKINGTIKDSKGKGIPDVKMTLKNKENGRSIILKTDKDGKYEHAFIPHAEYALSIEKEGYRTATTDWNLSVWAPKQIEVSKDYTLASNAEYQEIQDEKAAQDNYNKAYEAFQKGDCNTAKSKADDIVKKFPKHFPSYFMIGRCLAMENKTEEAIAQYVKVVELKPDLFEAYFDLGQLYYNKGDNVKAEESFKKAAELKPDDVEVSYNLAAIFFKDGKIDDAKTYAEKVLAVKPDHILANKVLGYITLNKGDFEKSIAYLQKYLQLEPGAKDKADITKLIEGLQAEVKKTKK